jgi:hypothetical protein
LLGHTASYCATSAIHLSALVSLFNSSLWEWKFGLISSNNNVNAYQIGELPVPRFELLGHTLPLLATGSDGIEKLHAVLEARQGAIDNVICRAESGTFSEKDAFRVLVDDSGSKLVHDVSHDALAALGSVASNLGARKAELQAELRQAVEASAECTIAGWTGVTSLRELDYLVWSDNGRASVGDAPFGVPWELIAQVYPSYPLPGINESAWEAAGWGEFCGVLRKNKGEIGNARIRADLTGSGAVVAPTGPMKKLQDTFLAYHRKVRQNRAKAAELDFMIDRILFRLFDLTLDEQKLILSRVGPGRPLPPRRNRGGKAKTARKDETPGLFESETS